MSQVTVGSRINGEIGNVSGPNPPASTDNAIATWDGTNGDTLQSSGSTISDSNILTTGGLVVANLVDAGPLYGNSSGEIAGVGNLTNGQIVIGQTGGNPIASTLTAGSNITITNSAGQITISSTGGGNISFTTDSGSATPSGDNLNIVGGEGIDVTATGSTVTIAAELATSGATVGAANIGAAAFDSSAFDVTSGFVTLKNPSPVTPNTYTDIFYFTDFLLENNNIEQPFVTSANFSHDHSSADNEHLGIGTLYTSSTDNNFGISIGAQMSRSANFGVIYLGGGQSSMMTLAKYETLPTQGLWGFGFLDQRWVDYTEGAFFIVEDMSSSYDVVCRTAISSTDEDTSSGVNLSTDWNKFEIIVNSDASEISFYINDSLITTRTTTLPATTTQMLAGHFIGLNNGTSSTKRLFVDYMEYKKKYTGDRA